MVNVFGPIRYLCQATLSVACVLALGIPAHAQVIIPGYPASVEANDPREVAMLPPYCLYTQSFRGAGPARNNPDQLKYWESVMGAATFNAMHHYCWGLMKTNRAIHLTRVQQTRMFYLNDSISEFDYVIDRAPPDFVLLPEILTRKGENLLLLGRGSAGIQALSRAIGLKPDYWPPYARISDYFVGVGDLKKAREPLQQGLSVTPDAKPLLRRLAELDAAKDKRKAAPQPDKPSPPSKPRPDG